MKAQPALDEDAENGSLTTPGIVLAIKRSGQRGYTVTLHYELAHDWARHEDSDHLEYP